MSANLQPVPLGNPWRKLVWGSAAFLLLLPALAMQFTSEVQWDAPDFIVVGLMLAAACGAFELAVRMSGSPAYRLAFGIAIVAAFLVAWINLAVGIIGSEDNAANLLFGGVLAVGLLGSLVARFRATGMARAMFAMAIAQMLVTGYAMFAGSLEGTVLSVFFAGAWTASGMLFRRAAAEAD